MTTVGNLITSLYFMLWVTLIPCGLINHDETPKTNFDEFKGKGNYRFVADRLNTTGLLKLCSIILLLKVYWLAIPKFSRELGRVSNFNQSINWHQQMKDHVEIGHFAKNYAFRMNRDQVMDLEIWFKIHKNISDLTVHLLKPGPPRKWKPIRRQNWNNRFKQFQIQPIKCPVQNNESHLVHWPVMFTRLRCRLNVKLKPVVLYVLTALGIIMCCTQFILDHWLI